MYVANINFREIPDIGFAFQHFCTNYKTEYRNTNLNIEVAYISSGTVELGLYDKNMIAEEGSVIVLFRHLPLTIKTIGLKPHSHCSVLASFENYDFNLFDDEESIFSEGFTIPFVTPHSEKCEEIGKILNRIASDMSKNREENALSSSVAFMSVLSMISDIFKTQNSRKSQHYKNIVSHVYKYVTENIEEKISLNSISEYINKTPNHIGHAFKSYTGINITQYINSQKAKEIAHLLIDSGLSFKDACLKVGISDDTYGYKIFKKHIGVTPKEYLLTQKIKKNV